MLSGCCVSSFQSLTVPWPVCVPLHPTVRSMVIVQYCVCGIGLRGCVIVNPVDGDAHPMRMCCVTMCNEYNTRMGLTCTYDV